MIIRLIRMIVTEPIYLIPAVALSREPKEAFLNVGFLSVFRSLYISYLRFVLGTDVRAEGYFWGIIMLASVFLLFYYGFPKRSSSLVYALFVSYLGLFIRYVPATVSVSSLAIRPFISKDKTSLEALSHALLSGAPVILALAYLCLQNEYFLIPSIILMNYFLLLSIAATIPAFFISRALLGYAVALYVFMNMPSGYYVIAKALIRPAVIGSEAIRFAIRLKRQEFLALSVASYGLSIITLYGEPLHIFLVGIVAFILSVVITAIFQDIISEL